MTIFAFAGTGPAGLSAFSVRPSDCGTPPPGATIGSNDAAAHWESSVGKRGGRGVNGISCAAVGFGFVVSSRKRATAVRHCLPWHMPVPKPVKRFTDSMSQ